MAGFFCLSGVLIGGGVAETERVYMIGRCFGHDCFELGFLIGGGGAKAEWVSLIGGGCGFVFSSRTI